VEARGIPYIKLKAFMSFYGLHLPAMHSWPFMVFQWSCRKPGVPFMPLGVLEDPLCFYFSSSPFKTLHRPYSIIVLHSVLPEILFVGTYSILEKAPLKNSTISLKGPYDFLEVPLNSPFKVPMIRKAL
jgi:hypothetical protein